MKKIVLWCISLSLIAKSNALPHHFLKRTVLTSPMRTLTHIPRSRLFNPRSLPTPTPTAPQQYTCQECSMACLCPTFRAGMDLAHIQPRGVIESGDKKQAVASSVGAALCYVPAAGILSLVSEMPQAALEAYSASAFLCVLGTTFAHRAYSCLKHANSAWWAANNLRLDISHKRNNTITMILGAFNTASYTHRSMNSQGSERVLSALVAAHQAHNTANAYNESDTLAQERIKTCIKTQKKLAILKNEILKKD